MDTNPNHFTPLALRVRGKNNNTTSNRTTFPIFYFENLSFSVTRYPLNWSSLCVYPAEFSLLTKFKLRPPDVFDYAHKIQLYARSRREQDELNKMTVLTGPSEVFMNYKLKPFMPASIYFTWKKSSFLNVLDHRVALRYVRRSC